MPNSVREGLVVRLVRRDEVDRFNTELDAHHWLGHRIVGQTMRYVATEADRWAPLLGFGSPALACAPSRPLGGLDQTAAVRTAYATSWATSGSASSLQGRRPNLASAVLARTLRRISADYQARWGHPVLVVETFTDPARHRGSCYAAAGFTVLGQTLGYRRSAGAYVHHANPKLAWARPLRRDARAILSAPFDHPILSPHPTTAVIDLNALELDGPQACSPSSDSCPTCAENVGPVIVRRRCWRSPQQRCWQGHATVS